MNREWIRIYRDRGVMPFAIPFILLLIFLLVSYENGEKYAEHIQEAEEIGLKLNKMELDIKNSKKFELKKQALSTSYVDLIEKSVRTESPLHSVQLLESHLKEILESLYFSDVKITGRSELKSKSSAELILNASFFGVPQQLPRLENTLQNGRYALRIISAKIEAEPDPMNGDNRLKIDLTFLGLHFKSENNIAGETLNKSL